MRGQDSDLLRAVTKTKQRLYQETLEYNHRRTKTSHDTDSLYKNCKNNFNQTGPVIQPKKEEFRGSDAKAYTGTALTGGKAEGTMPNSTDSTRIAKLVRNSSKFKERETDKGSVILMKVNF